MYLFYMEGKRPVSRINQVRGRKGAAERPHHRGEKLVFAFGERLHIAGLLVSPQRRVSKKEKQESLCWGVCRLKGKNQTKEEEEGGVARPFIKEGKSTLISVKGAWAKDSLTARGKGTKSSPAKEDDGGLG